MPRNLLLSVRSLIDLNPFHVIAADGQDLGRILDFIVERAPGDNSSHWDLRALVVGQSAHSVQTHYWIRPNELAELSMVERRAHLNVSAQALNLESTVNAPLISLRTLLGAEIATRQTRSGTLEDAVIHTADWRIEALVVNLSSWWPLTESRRVSPRHLVDIGRVDGASLIELDLTRDELRDAPHFLPDEAVNREVGAEALDYYGRAAGDNSTGWAGGSAGWPR